MFHNPYSILEYVLDSIILSVLYHCDLNTILSSIIAIVTIIRLTLNIYRDIIMHKDRKEASRTKNPEQ